MDQRTCKPSSMNFLWWIIWQAVTSWGCNSKRVQNLVTMNWKSVVRNMTLYYLNLHSPWSMDMYAMHSMSLKCDTLTTWSQIIEVQLHLNYVTIVCKATTMRWSSYDDYRARKLNHIVFWINRPPSQQLQAIHTRLVYKILVVHNPSGVPTCACRALSTAIWCSILSIDLCSSAFSSIFFTKLLYMSCSSALAWSSCCLSSFWVMMSR